MVMTRKSSEDKHSGKLDRAMKIDNKKKLKVTKRKGKRTVLLGTEEKNEELDCVESLTRLSKIEMHVSELKCEINDVKKDLSEMKDLLHLILDSQREKTSDGDEETGDKCGPTVGDENELVDVGPTDGVEKNNEHIQQQSKVYDQMLPNEVKKLESDMNELQKSKLEEIEKRDEKIVRLESEINELREKNREGMEKRDEVIVSLESELCGKEHLIQCYREAFKEMHKDFSEEPISKDVAGTTNYNTLTDAKIESQQCMKQEKDR